MLEGELKLVGPIFSKKRFFCIESTTGEGGNSSSNSRSRLVMFDKRPPPAEPSQVQGPVKDFILLESGLTTVERHAKKPRCIKVVFRQHKKSKTWVLQCRSDEEMRQWMEEMERLIEESAQRIAGKMAKMTKKSPAAAAAASSSLSVGVVTDGRDQGEDDGNNDQEEEEEERAAVVMQPQRDDDSDESDDSDDRNLPYLPSDTSSDEDSVFEGAERSDDEDDNDNGNTGGPAAFGDVKRSVEEFASVEQGIAQLEVCQADEDACRVACEYLRSHLDRDADGEEIGVTVLRRESLQQLLNVAVQFRSDPSIVFIVLKCIQLAMKQDTTEKSRTLLRLVRGISLITDVLKSVHSLAAASAQTTPKKDDVDSQPAAKGEIKPESDKDTVSAAAAAAAVADNGYDSDDELEDINGHRMRPVEAHVCAITDCIFILKQLLSRKSAFSTEFIREGMFTALIEIVQEYLKDTYLLAIEFIDLAINLCNCEATLALPVMCDRGGHLTIATAIKHYPLEVEEILLLCVKYASLLQKDQDIEDFGRALAHGGAVEELVCITLPRFLKQHRLQQIVFKFFQQLGHSVSLYRALATEVFEKHRDNSESCLNGALLLSHLVSPVNMQQIAEANIMDTCLQTLHAYIDKQGWVVRHILLFVHMAMQNDKKQDQIFVEKDGYSHLFDVVSIYGSNDEMLQLCMDVFDVLVNDSETSLKPLYTEYLVRGVESLLRLIETSSNKKELLCQELELLAAITQHADFDDSDASKPKGSVINEQIRSDLIGFMFDVVRNNNEDQRDIVLHALKILRNIVHRFEPFGLEESEVRLLYWAIEKNLNLEKGDADDEELVTVLLELCGHLAKMHQNRDLMVKHKLTFKFRTLLDLHKAVDAINKAAETIKVTMGI